MPESPPLVARTARPGPRWRPRWGSYSDHLHSGRPGPSQALLFAIKEATSPAYLHGHARPKPETPDLSLPQEKVSRPQDRGHQQKAKNSLLENPSTPRFLRAHVDVGGVSHPSPQNRARDTPFCPRTPFQPKRRRSKTGNKLLSVSRTTMPPPLMTRAAWRKIFEARVNVVQVFAQLNFRRDDCPLFSRDLAPREREKACFSSQESETQRWLWTPFARDGRPSLAFNYGADTCTTAQPAGRLPFCLPRTSRALSSTRRNPIMPGGADPAQL
jgi:hypothetical protein